MTDARAFLDRAMTEDELQDRIIDTARQFGWMCYHTWRSDHSERGFPDLILIRGGRLLAFELKRQDEKPTIAQRHWLRLFAGVRHVESRLVRPSDLDEIDELLIGEEAG